MWKKAFENFEGGIAELCDDEGEELPVGEAGTIYFADGPQFEQRLLALPGIGAMKAKAMLAILKRRFGVDLEGMETVMPNYPTLADVDSAEALADYQAQKRAYKAKLKAEGGDFAANDIGTARKR